MLKTLQPPGHATLLKRFFRDNFVTFRRRSKRIAFLESVNFSTCVYVQIFNLYPRDVVNGVFATATWLAGWVGGWLSVTAGIVPND